MAKRRIFYTLRFIMVTLHRAVKSDISSVLAYGLSRRSYLEGPRNERKFSQLRREPKRALLLCELPVLQSSRGFEVTSATLVEYLVSHS